MTMVDPAVSVTAEQIAYFRSEHAAIATTQDSVQRATRDVPLLKAQIDQLQKQLADAENCLALNAVALPLRIRALQLLASEMNFELPPLTCGDVPATVSLPPAPTATLGGESVSGNPACSVCGHLIEQIGSALFHAGTGLVECAEEHIAEFRKAQTGNKAPGLDCGTTTETLPRPIKASDIRTNDVVTDENNTEWRCTAPNTLINPDGENWPTGDAEEIHGQFTLIARNGAGK
ncbi:hypothetical protein EDD29_0143 [Actinocorallia herbida]|uniref:Uncharacterized protein n=1 Tax=Actinocorallia herbida TaxID=58109 RepID=A0A3N1CMY4_9ACTN|nr:hypothetical protein [Actinocorallia herbida]ROO82662.1 hypothetical protein EDD29_0143 [Actinocorallia herbida]